MTRLLPLAPYAYGVDAAGFAHWALLVRGRKVERAQRVLAGQWHLVRLHASIFGAWRGHAHKLQVTPCSDSTLNI